MSFDEKQDRQFFDWNSISKLILSYSQIPLILFRDKKKPFQMALDKLNKIKCKRFDRQLYDKSDGKLKVNNQLLFCVNCTIEI